MTGPSPFFEQKTVIAYYDPFDVLSDIRGTFQSQFPLTRLHWNHSLRPLRTIDKLDVDLVEETAHSQATPKHQMLGLSPEPYLKIALVKCEDNETYRGTIRKIIREWFEKNVTGVRDPTEWLIVHYVPPGGKASSSTRFKYGVLDKIKVDFNSDSKKDRVLQIRKDYPTQEAQADAWKDLMTRIKEGLLNAFSSRVDLYQDEINKLETEKHVLGWNFGKFFVMKEGLALAFERMNLYDDALLLYDELEESFLQIQQSKAITFFTEVGFDTIPPPLLILQKDAGMRHLILSNEITLFGFHVYLFARQAFLILCIAKASTSRSIGSVKVGELFLRLRSFLGEITGLLLSNKKNSQAISEWTYNVAQEFLGSTSWVDSSVVREVAEGRGELILLLRSSLELIAATKSWVIEGVLSEVSLESKSDNTKEHLIANEIMKRNLESSTIFYEEYKSLTLQALAEFKVADKGRIQTLLTSQLALLDYQLGNYESASDLLRSIPNIFASQGWDLVSTSLLTVYLNCLKHFDRKEDTLINSLELLSRHSHLSQEDIKERIDVIQSLADVVSCSTNLDNFFSTTIDSNVVTASDSDTFILQATLTNPLKFPFNIDSATITMRNVNDSSDVLSFEVKETAPIVLQPGNTTLKFENRRFEQVKFKVTALFITRGKLSFTKNYTENMPILLQLYSSSQNLNASYRIPPTSLLVERRIGLVINSGVNNVTSGTVSFKAVTPGLKFITTKAQNDDTVNNSAIVKVTDGRPPVVSFSNLEAGTSTMITVPYVIDFDVMNVRVRSIINYKTAKGDFQHILEDAIDISLALSVNVQDFYKGDKLFSKFLISCNHPERPVLILETDLKSTETYETSSPSGSTRSCISYPTCPVSYVFCIKKKSTTPAVVESVPLVIKHRYIHEECLFEISKAIDTTLEGTKYDRYSLLLKKSLSFLTLDLMSYLRSGKIIIKSGAWNYLRGLEILSMLSHTEKDELILLLDTALSSSLRSQLALCKDGRYDAITKSLVIPVSIPQVHLVHNVELLLPTEDHFVVGKSVACNLSISTIQSWAPPNSKSVLNERTKFIYDLGVSENWAFSGKKRSFFEVGDGVEQTFKLTLIPLRTGKLLFPRVDIQMVQPLSKSTFSMEVSYRNEYQFAVVVPEFKDRLTLTF